MEDEKTFLEEGYDFIEESCSATPLEFTETDKDIIVESNGEKSPYHILGTCRGVFQSINEPSRNMRIYESNHWEIQLSKPEVQERLKTRSMWGTLGHFDRKITDGDVREGLVSHIITKLEIHEDANGKPFLYGELEILDTPSGRILEGMYKGGANLFVSSRGAGKLLTVPGDTMKHVDPNSFWFEGFDIVRAAGFPKARPVYESAVSEEVSEARNPNYKTLESSEIENLKGQIDKLTKIIEKVVDDVYEIEEPVEEGRKEGESDEEMKHRLHGELVRAIDDKADKAKKEAIEGKKGAYEKYKKEHDKLDKLDDIEPVANAYIEVKNEALADFISLMADSTVSEKVFEEIVDMIAKAKENK